jgi:copper chaperone CopZ
MPGNLELGRMLQDFTTRDEKVGPKQYAATFQLRFRGGRVQKYLASHGETPAATTATAPITPNTTESGTTSSHTSAITPQMQPSPPEQSQTPLLILPFLQTAQGQVLWMGNNPLRDQLLQTTHPSIAILPMGDMDDQQIFNEQAGIRATPQSFQNLLYKYQTDRMIVVVGVPDTLNPQTPATKMTLMFYGVSARNPTPDYLDSVVASIADLATSAPNALFTNAAGHIHTQIGSLKSRINMNVPEQDILVTPLVPNAPLSQTAPAPDTLSNENVLIVSSGVAQMQDDMAATQAPMIEPSVGQAFTEQLSENPATEIITPSSFDATLPLAVRFHTMTEWNDIRTRIKSIPGVESVMIHKLKAQEATINIQSPTLSPSTLASALQSRGLSLYGDASNLNDGPRMILVRGALQSRVTMDGR